MRMNRFIGSKLPVCQRSRMGISSSFEPITSHKDKGDDARI